MPAMKLKRFLDENQVRYVSIQHSPAYTAQEIAASAHIPGRELAKTVMVKIDGQMALAGEKEFQSMFPDCEAGAMPPFGNLYGLKVYADELLTHDVSIAFNAGTHAELIQMSYADFVHWVQPVIAPLARALKAPA